MAKTRKRGATRITPEAGPRAASHNTHIHHHSSKKTGWIALVLLVFSFAVSANWPGSTSIVAGGERSFAIQLPELQAQPETTLQETEEPQIQWKEVVVRPGDSLERIFIRENLSRAMVETIMSSSPAARILANLHPGQVVKMHSVDGQLNQLQFSPSRAETLEVKKTAQGFSSELIKREYDIQLKYAEGQIRDALFLAGQEAGLSDNVIMKLAQLFAWDVDFVLDIRQGDSFKLLFEEYYMDGEKVKDGDILAAYFVNKGKTYAAFRHVKSNGDTEYYTSEGHSIRREFLRTPVEFARISSRFNLKRKHPILHTIRAHRGVDYAAPRGTPIKATGEGKVIFAGRKGGYGNVLEIRHGQKYTTLYAHVKNFARGVRKGSKVRQGQTVAYVGSSGLATGPHLHYEFRVNGVHKNPLSVPLPKAQHIDPQEKENFLANTETLKARLGLLSEVYTIAQNEFQ